MCRISGIVDKSSQCIGLDVIRMRDAMKHGGPDNAGFYIDENAHIALGHRRLSIIDLADSGNQPMMNTSKDVVVVFNGEIYNYQELRNQLITAGHVFSTNSDTEVILKSFERWGTDCFVKFRGMFAIALYDKKNNELILARDHAGIKPLYYYTNESSIYFASEIRAFKALKGKWQENPDWKVYFLAYGYLPRSITTLKNVHPLEKGSYRVFNLTTLESQQYSYSNDNYTEEITTTQHACDLISKTLDVAVKRHLVADAPIGLFLSGGIDSSLIALLAKKYKKKDLHTLSVIFDDAKFSEAKYQNIIAQKTGSKHQSFILNKGMFLKALPDILNAMDQPSADGVNSYFISKFAKQAGLKAVLSGLGADELFGGYSSFKRTRLLNNLKSIPGFMLSAASYLPQDKYQKIQFLKSKNLTGDYLFNRGFFTSTGIARHLDVAEQEVDNLLNNLPVPEFATRLKNGNKVSFLESNFYMEGQLLKDTDFMSMWHSIEVRVPFLDYDLINTAQKISSTVKFGNKQSKFLLIQSFKDILPQEIWNRKKQGFVFPFEVWMKDHIDQFMPTKQNKYLSEKFKSGKLTWSRYWTYLVAQSFNA